MSGRTWVMMIFILALNWGGFVAALIYGVMRDEGSRQQ